MKGQKGENQKLRRNSKTKVDKDVLGYDSRR